jgi:hypothetical protein
LKLGQPDPETPGMAGAALTTTGHAASPD